MHRRLATDDGPSLRDAFAVGTKEPRKNRFIGPSRDSIGCGRLESNQHVLSGHKNLNLARLPIPPRPRRVLPAGSEPVAGANATPGRTGVNRAHQPYDPGAMK